MGMSYRTIKRLLGETSLERKCRFLFGGALVLLISGSFYFYGRLNTNLVYEQNESRARMAVDPKLIEHGWRSGQSSDYQPVIDEFVGAVQSAELAEISYQLLKTSPDTKDPFVVPDDPTGFDALARIRQGDTEVTDYVQDEKDGKRYYHYYRALTAEKSCMRGCHERLDPDVKEGELFAMIKITFPLEKTEKAVAWNTAILLATAIVTAFLAMLAVYAMVRYVIVKPVLHLKDVSDEIAHGNLDLRADIRTGDEFEELSHAFNRMLRHLVTVGDELREVNVNLDGKVDELAQVNLRLYEMNKLKDEFLATISHELRTPLNSILGFSDVLAGVDNLNEKQKRYVANIQSSGRDLMNLISDVLDLAKIESGKMELQIVEVSMGDLIERRVGALLPLAERKNIDLTWYVDSTLPVLLQDAGKLEQIANNLLSNAIKFTPEGGRVRTRAERSGDSLFELIVEDTGVGIPLEEQETIFEKFRQGKVIPGQRDTLTREYGGTGLGLSIVKELSKLLGGEVLLDSEFGKGSMFIVRLPIRLERLPRLMDEESRRQAFGLAGTRLPDRRPDGSGSETVKSEPAVVANQGRH